MSSYYPRGGDKRGRYNNNNNYNQARGYNDGYNNNSNYNQARGYDDGHNHHHNNTYNQPRGYNGSHNKNDNHDSVITCAFYNKIGACRHGEKCSKKHIKPTTSKTLLLANLYQNPKLNKNETEELTEKQIQEQFDLFYQDIFIHLGSMGEIYDLVVCENENNHLNGNVYVQFNSALDASLVNTALNQEWFNGRPVHSDLSPVDSFPDAHCRAYDTNSCERGEMCNYMHIRQPTTSLKQLLYKAQDKMYSGVKLEKLKKQLSEMQQLGAETVVVSVNAEGKEEEGEEEEEDEGGNVPKQDASKLLNLLF